MSRNIRIVMPVERTIIDGFDIDSNTLPSERFFTGKVGSVPKTRLDDLYREPSVSELKAGQKELYRLYKQGEIPSAQYQKEWYALEEQIKALREPQIEAEDDDEEL